MKKNQKNIWVTVAIIAGSILAAVGMVYGMIKALQSIFTEARYHALEKALREPDLDTDAILSSCVAPVDENEIEF